MEIGTTSRANIPHLGGCCADGVDRVHRALDDPGGKVERGRSAQEVCGPPLERGVDLHERAHLSPEVGRQNGAPAAHGETGVRRGFFPALAKLLGKLV